MGCKAETEIGQDLLDYTGTTPGTKKYHVARKRALARMADGETLAFATSGSGCGSCGGSGRREFTATRIGDELTITEV